MAEIKINKEQWEGLSVEERARIEGILLGAGSLEPGDTLVADPGAAKVPVQDGDSFDGNPLKGICKALCDAAYTVAVVKCKTLPPPWSSICIAVATTLRDKCKKQC